MTLRSSFDGPQAEIRDAIGGAGDEVVAILGSVNDAVVITDREGRITRFNPIAEQLTGWSHAEVAGRPIDEVLPVVSDQHHLPMSWRWAELMAGTAPLVERLRLIARDGGERLIGQSASPIVEADGSRSGLVVAFRDLETQREMEQQIQVSNRMVSIGTIAAGVAHEINNPLSALIGNLFLLSEALSPGARAGAPRSDPNRAGALALRSPASMQSLLSEAIEAAEHVRQIVRDIKLFSRPEDNAEVPLDLAKVVEAALRMTRNEVRHRARLVKDFRQTSWVLANEARLGQVFVNLLVNAAQSIPEGKADDNEIRVSVGASSPTEALVEIRDTGAGIPPDILPRIFEPFFTTKGVGVGTGLGLTICQRLVRETRGSIEVESQPGRGTLVRVLLPIFRTDTPDGKLPSLDARPIGPRRGRVLVIDDDALVRHSIERVLSGQHAVVGEERAADALHRLAGGQRFDVILCDVMMPQMTGLEFRELLGEIAPDQVERVVYITAGVLGSDAARSVAEGPTRVIEKPMDMSRLRALVARLVESTPSQAEEA